MSFSQVLHMSWVENAWKKINLIQIVSTFFFIFLHLLLWSLCSSSKKSKNLWLIGMSVHAALINPPVKKQTDKKRTLGYMNINNYVNFYKILNSQSAVDKWFFFRWEALAQMIQKV